MFDIQITFENKSISDIILSALHFWNKLPSILTPKDLDKKLFFIVNSGKAGRCYFCFIISKAGRCYSHLTNQ